MMKRFTRRGRKAAESQKNAVGGVDVLAKILELGLVEAETLEAWSDAAIPSGVATIGQGKRKDGTALIVSFSPKSGTEALLAGLSAAQFAVEKSEFAGQLAVVTPQWSTGARRLLALLGRTTYAVEAISAPGLGIGRPLVEAEPDLPVLAASATQLAGRLSSAEARAGFLRAAVALEGLAAKHVGTVRAGIDRLELVVLARRVAEIRTEGDSAVLEIQLGGGAATPLSGADLPLALDGLEGQLRRRLMDRKTRDGEEGLRGRVIAKLASGSELRGLRPWPTPGADLDIVDGVGLNSSGDPVMIAVREELDWTTLGLVLEAMAPLSSRLPVLFADAAPPIRFAMPRLLLAAERFADGLERALSGLTVAYELRSVSGSAGAAVDLVSSGAGEGAQSRTPRRGRRRGGRGRTNGRDETSDESLTSTGPAADRGTRPDRNRANAASDGNDAGHRSKRSEGAEKEGLADSGGESSRADVRRGRRPSARTVDGASAAQGTASGTEPSTHSRESSSTASSEDDSVSEESGQGRGRRRRRSRRGGRGANGDAPTEGAALEGRENQEGRGGEGSSRRRPKFEEVSLMDLDDAPGGASSARNARTANENSDRGDGARRGGRRSRRGGKSNSNVGGDADDGAKRAADEPEPVLDVVEEEDLVDADDLLEILARLTESEPDFEPGDSTEENFEDDEEIDEDASQSDRRRARESRQRSRKGDGGDDAGNRGLGRGRAAILVHADRDSLLSAVLLARDVRQLEGMWIYPQEELMTFFRSIATDLREDTPIFVVGFTPSPARDVIQAASLYRGRMSWFGRQSWPPEDLVEMRNSLGKDSVIGGDGIDSVLPLVLETCSRRSRFSDKLVDLAAGRFTQHDFERWGRLWRWRAGEIAAKSGDIRSDIAALLAGRPSDLAKEAALVEVPPPPIEIAWVAERDFRLVHFGGHVMVVVEVDGDLDVQMCARVARERYSATLSLSYRIGEETFVFGGDETTGKRTLDHMAVAEHLVNKLEWVDARADADHVARFRVRDLERNPERLDEIIGEIAMGRSLLER